MELELSPLWNEIRKVVDAGVKPVAYHWIGEIHYLDQTLPLFKVISIDNIRNYEVNFSDVLIVETKILRGAFAKLIYPNRDKLEITLYKEPLLEKKDHVKKDTDLITERFKAVPCLKDLKGFDATDFSRYNRDTLDLMEPIDISFQLINKGLEKLRITTVGGIFRSVKNDEVLKGLLTKESLDLKTNGKPSIIGVDMVPADNKDKKNHTIIPQGTKLLEVPSYIQEKCGGVYNSGLGVYLQAKVWWLYPLYNTERLLTEKRNTLTILKVPKNRFLGIERTYRIEGTSTFIIATSNSVITDEANTRFMNHGNGVRKADAKQFMSKPVQTKDNKANIARGKLNNEFLIKKNADGVDNIQLSPDPIGSNIFNEFTRLTARNGSILEFIWDSSLPEVLIPGMMVKVLYMDNENLVELNGVLLYVHVVTQLNGRGITVKSHITTSHLGIFFKRKPK